MAEAGRSSHIIMCGADGSRSRTKECSCKDCGRMCKHEASYLECSGHAKVNVDLRHAIIIIM